MFLKAFDENNLLKNLKFDKRNYQDKKNNFNGEKKGFKLANRKGKKHFTSTSFDQSVIFKMSYTGAKWHTASYISENTKSHIEYMLREEAVKTKTAFNDTEDNIKLDELLKKFDGEKIFKIIISPERSELANMNYTRKIMDELKIATGINLKWASVIHTNTKVPHIHIIISRECGNYDISKETPLYFNPKFIKNEFRKEILEKEATKRLGKVSQFEYQQKYIKDVNKIGLGKIDHDINRLEKDSTIKIARWKEYYIHRRKNFLKENFDNIVYKNNSKKFKKDWMKNLLIQNKLNEFNYNFDKSKVVVENPSNQVQEPFKGKVVDMKITDELNEKVSFIVIDKFKIPHLIEVKIKLSDIKKVLNKEITVSYNFKKARGYREPVITEVEGNKNWKFDNKKQKIGGIK